MSLALITVHRDYLSMRVSFSFLPTLREVNEAMTPLFPSPRPATCCFLCVLCHSVWYCIKAIHGSGWTKSNLSQKWTNMDVTYKACSNAFDITQSLSTSQEWYAFFFIIFYFLAMQDWRFNTDLLVRRLRSSYVETIYWWTKYFVLYSKKERWTKIE